jgi:ATP-dependent Lon protease
VTAKRADEPAPKAPPKTGSKAAPKAASKAESKPESKPESKAEPKTAPKAGASKAPRAATKNELPLLAVKNSVLYPYVVLPFSVGRTASIAALNEALKSEDKLIAVFAQRDDKVDVPAAKDLFRMGTRAVVKRMGRSEETVEVLLQGLERVELVDIVRTEPSPRVRVAAAPLPADAGPQTEAMQRELLDLANKLQELAEPITQFDFAEFVSRVEDPMHFVYLLATMTGLDKDGAQRLLEAPTRLDAMRVMHEHLVREYQVLEVRKQIAGAVQTEMGKAQREHLLRQQMRAIQEELGERDPQEADVAVLRERFGQVELPDDVRKEVERELGRLERLSPASPDHQVARTYLELVLELPWRAETEDDLDLDRARRVLEEDHYGLDEVKERILEHLAVLKLNPEAKAPILCFVGPPGVGKTSVGQSIARALGRKFERLSLGGMHDEGELRGHRRTYIGAMPGRILQAVRRAGVRNPLIMLDEVDKLGQDFRGDPASALLEILDPAQNHKFRDNYLDLPFDLSRVLFLCTANALDPVPRPLLDRMEILRLAGYSHDEKKEIARRYLLPRQRAEAGLTEAQLVVPDETLLAIVSRYTREAGVRELERMLGRLARKIALKVATGEAVPETISPDALGDLLGPERFFLEQARRDLAPGVATGLAWTYAGGDVLYVEALQLPEGGDRLVLTGQLGHVMQESARAAHNYVVSKGAAFGIEPPRAGIHIHVPAGAIPKDGPSAGVTIATAVASLYTNLPVRGDTAMTGEITLSGLVLPVGGIKEKVLAAHRAGLRRVILPVQNEKDLTELPEGVRAEMEFVFADTIERAVAAAIPALAERLSTPA